LKHSGIRSIAINASYLTGSRVLTMFVRGIYVIVLARYLGPEIYGLFAYGHSWYVAFLPLAGLGMAQILSREVGRDREKGAEVVAQSLALQTMTAFAGAVLCAFIGWLTDHDPFARQLLIIFSLALAGRGLALWSEQVFVAYEASRYTLQQEALFRSIEVVVGCSVLLLGGRALALAVVHALIWWLQAIRGLVLVRRNLIRVQSKWSWHGLLSLITKGFPLCLGTLFLGWLMQGPLVLFRHVPSASDTLGQLALALQLFGLLLSVPLSIGTVALPILSRSAARQDGKDLRFVEVMLRITLILVAIAGLCGMALGPWLVTLVFGNQYSLAGHLLGPALWLLIPFSMAISTSQVLIGKGHFVASSFCAFCGALVLTLALPSIATEIGPYGALLATGLGMSLWAGTLIVLLVWSDGLNIGLAILRPAVVVLLSVGVYIGLVRVSPWVALPASLLTLLAATFAFGVVTAAERAAFRARLRLYQLQR